MINILYIGNKLKSSFTNQTSIFSLGSLLEQEGLKMVYASEKAQPLLRLLDMVYTTLKYQNQVEWILIDTYSTRNFYYALIISQLCRLFGKKYVPKLGGGNLPQRLEKNPYLSKLIFKNAKYNIAPSLYLKEAFEKQGYNNIIHIPNAIDINHYPFAMRSFETPKFLWVRSFAGIYNPKLAVNVLKQLNDKGFQAELCMVGPDSDGTLTEVKTLAKNLGVTVKFTGKLTKPEWTSLAKEYNIFINTTNFDNTPVSVMEAMALGLPVVSTNVGGMPYLITHEKDGLLVPPGDAAAMIAAVERLLNDKVLCRHIIDNARAKAESFDWSVIKKKWHEVFEV